MKETITITQTDIDMADAGGACPVSLAIRRKHPGWIVNRTQVLDFNYDVVTPLPGPVIAFICDFNAGMAVEPMEFEIEV